MSWVLIVAIGYIGHGIYSISVEMPDYSTCEIAAMKATNDLTQNTDFERTFVVTSCIKRDYSKQ